MNDRVRERNILLVTAVAHFLAHFYMLVFPSLALALRDEWGLPFDQVLGLSFWMYLLYGLGALPSGLLTDLWRPRWMLAICLLGTSGCALLAALADGPAALRASLAGLGLAASIYHPAGMALISRGVRRRGSALGINGVFGNLGVVTAPFITGLLTVSLGWRSAYAVMAVPGLAAGVWALFLRVEGDVPEPSRSRGASRRRIAVSFAVLCLAMMMGGLAYRGQTLVLPAWFAERIGFLVDAIAGAGWLPRTGGSLLAATTLTSVSYLAGAAGQVVGGRLADRHDLRRMYLLFHAASLPAMYLLGSLSDAPLLLCAMCYAFFAFGMQPIENSLVSALTPPRLRSTGYGLKFILTFGVGAAAVPLVGGWEQAGGLAAVFPKLSGFIVLLLALASLLWAVSRRMDLRNG